jgi:hypothetical protein
VYRPEGGGRVPVSPHLKRYLSITKDETAAETSMNVLPFFLTAMGGAYIATPLAARDTYFRLAADPSLPSPASRG